jgi:hypothetical protein
VPIMAAGMHDAWIVALIGKPGRFLDRQRVHVGANADPLLPLSAREGSDDACSGNARRHLVAPGGELGCDDLACPALLEGELRILVKVAAQSDELVDIAGDGCLNLVVRFQGLGNGVHDFSRDASGADGLCGFHAVQRCRVAAFAIWQAEMIAQRLAFQHRIEITAPRQDRQDMSGEIIEAFGDDGEAEDEAVGCAIVLPADDLIGNMVRRADEISPRGGYVSFLSWAVLLIRSVVARKLFLPMSPSSGNGASNS